MARVAWARDFIGNRIGERLRRANEGAAEGGYLDGRASTVTATDAPKATQRTDGTTANADYNTLGQQTSQSGAGQLAAGFGYDATTGQLNSLSTFSSGNLNGTGKSTTTWGFSPSTGMETSKTYADQSQQQLKYNAKLQVEKVFAQDAGGNNTMEGTLGYNTAAMSPGPATPT